MFQADGVRPQSPPAAAEIIWSADLDSDVPQQTVAPITRGDSVLMDAEFGGVITEYPSEIFTISDGG